VLGEHERFFANDDWQLWIYNTYESTMKGVTDFNYMKKDEINFIKRHYPKIDLSHTLPRKTNVHLKYLAPKDFLLIGDDYNIVDCPGYLETTKKEMMENYKNKPLEEVQMLFD